MSKQLNIVKLSEMIKSKRGNVGLRTLGAQIGISASTLSRIELGNLPDIDTYIKLCNWLDVSTEFFTITGPKEDNVKSNVIAHLRADKDLPDTTANAIIEMINLAYDAATKEKGI